MGLRSRRQRAALVLSRYITHDLATVRAIVDEIIVMFQGARGNEIAMRLHQPSCGPAVLISSCARPGHAAKLITRRASVLVF
jgi:ABC-type sugar transport system ATPase subunit